MLQELGTFHRSSDIQDFCFSLFVKEHRDFFSKISRFVGVIFNANLSRFAWGKWLFRPTGSSTAAGGTHRFQ